MESVATVSLRAKTGIRIVLTSLPAIAVLLTRSSTVHAQQHQHQTGWSFRSRAAG
ncbi:MAG: hypothetical protein ACREK1_00530 [Longimicrobiales bacterium]